MTRRPSLLALRSLFAVTALIAVLAYLVSAWGVYGFARAVWLLPVSYSFAVAIGADLLSLAGALASYVLRNERFRVRSYAWLVFFGMTGLSVAANEGFAAHRGLSFGGRVASAAVVGALAAAVHLLIVAKRHADQEGEAKDEPAPAKTPAPRKAPAREATPSEPAAVAAERAAIAAEQPIHNKNLKVPAVPRPQGLRLPDQRRDEFVLRVLAGERAADVAKDAGVSKRAVEIWVKAYRERQSGHVAGEIPAAQPDPPTADGGLLSDAAFTQVNGHKPGSEVTA